MQKKGLEYLSEAKSIVGLPIVSEIMDPRQLESSLEYIHIVQAEFRSKKNYIRDSKTGSRSRNGAVDE